MTQAVTDAEWQQVVLEADKPVLVDFWAAWCGPCRMVGPIVDEIGRENAEHLTVLKLDVDANPKVTQKYRVMSIPSLIVFKGGDEAKRIVGARGKAQLLDDLRDYLPAPTG